MLVKFISNKATHNRLLMFCTTHVAEPENNYTKIYRESLFSAATFPDSSNTSDSRQCLKDTNTGSTAVDMSVTGNHLDIPRAGENPNLLSPEMINQRRNSRRPSILPVPDMFTSSTLNISQDVADEGDESEDELEDDVPWRSPSEKIA